MKTVNLLLGFCAGIALAAHGDGTTGSYSSVSAVTTHAANNGGFSQPPITVTAHEAQANPTIEDSIAGRAKAASGKSTSMVVPIGSGYFPPPFPDSTSYPWYPAPDTNAVPYTDGSDVTVTTNANGAADRVISHMNADGDVTNANGTMTFNTNSPHWWEKK